MCVFLVCVLGSFRASVCAFRVSELLVVRLSFVVKLFRLRCVAREIPKSSCRVLNSSFSFEFVVEIFVSNFEFVFFVSSLYSISRISIFDSNLSSKFSMACSIRLLEFHCSSRFLEFRVFDSSALNFEFVLIYSTSRIVVESFVDLFDFSNFDL